MVRTIAHVGRVASEDQPQPASDLFVPARRRALVRHLADCDPGTIVELDDLARAIAAREGGDDPATLDEADYERVLVDLHEDHLPRLAEADLVAVERDGGIFVRPDAAALAAV